MSHIPIGGLAAVALAILTAVGGAPAGAQSPGTAGRESYTQRGTVDVSGRIVDPSGKEIGGWSWTARASPSMWPPCAWIAQDA